MNMNLMILPLLVFVAVSVAIGAVFMLVTPSRAQRRLRAVAPSAAEPSGWSETVLKVAGPLAKLSIPEGQWDHSPLRIRFMNAGIRHPDARLYYFAAKTFVPLVLAAVTYFTLRASSETQGMSMLLTMLIAALVGTYLPNLVLHLSVRSRQREIFENFPDASDLMLVCVEAGLGLDAALTRVSDEIRRKSVALAEELHLTNLEMRAGATREKALRNLALRTGVEELMSFATMITQADKFGTSIADSLRVFSQELRHKRHVRAEEQAAKIPTKMLFPLVLFIFPATIMVVMGPAIVQILRTLLPLIGEGKI